MGVAYNKFNSFVEAVCEEKHDFSADTLEVALCAVAPAAANAVLADLTQISYTNLSARTLSGIVSSQVAGLYKLLADDLVLTASGAVATFRYVVVFNQTAPNDELICWWDNGSNVTLSAGQTFTIDFNATNGIFTLQ